MYTNSVHTIRRAILAATLTGWTLFAGIVVAEDQPFVVSMHVTSQGLDLSQPAGAQQFYARLARAARIVCTHGDRVDLAPVADPRGCYERALGDAIRSTNVSQVTEIYLATHTPQDAAAHGIGVPVQIATK